MTGLTVRDPLAELLGAVRSAVAVVRGQTGGSGSGSGRLPRSPGSSVPSAQGQGDYSTNAAMLLAPVLGEPPREIAERIGAALAELLGDRARTGRGGRAGIPQPVLSDVWHRDALADVLGAGDRFGAGAAQAPERILLEFVSANPTGPLVAASGRHAAYGDALARILEHYGHTVSREYYFNDAGSQIRLLGESVRARARNEDVPEGGYQGDYVIDLARSIPGAAAMDVWRARRARGRAAAGQDQGDARPLRRPLRRLLQRADAARGLAERARARARLAAGARPRVPLDGAVWLRTTTFGDDKDRVLVRSGGEPTYLAADVAYMLNKRERGFERQLLPVGADHHGYARELKAAMPRWAAIPRRSRS